MTLYHDNVLKPHLFPNGVSKRIFIRVCCDLDDSGVISEVDEGDGTMDTVQSDPATQTNAGTEVMRAKGTTVMGTGGPLKGLRRGLLCRERRGDGRSRSRSRGRDKR